MKMLKKLAFVAALVMAPSSVIATPAYNGTLVGDACYTKRKLPISIKEAFNAMKDTFMNSNINLVNISEEDGVLYGKGFFKKGDDYYSLTITVSFKDLGDVTEISTIISYSLTANEHRTDTAGVAGIQFPMPVPWKTELNVKENGNIQDPYFYIGFYNNFEKILFADRMQPVVKIDKKTVKKVEVKETNTTEDLF